MIRKNRYITKYSFLALLLLMLAFSGCQEEPVELTPSPDLEALIAEAEDLIATSEEGTSPGDYKPGSIKQLQDVLTWVDWILVNGEDQSEVDKAAVRLEK